MAKALEEGVAKLPEKKLQTIDLRINQICEQYDQVVFAGGTMSLWVAATQAA